MDDEHPQRVHLDSIHNWTVIRKALSEQLDQSLSEAVDSRNAGHVRDAARLHLDQVCTQVTIDAWHTTMIKQWLEAMLDSAKDSILINGQSVDDSLADSQSMRRAFELVLLLRLSTETEPYDEVLNARLWELSNDRIHHSTLIANERRSKPTQVEQLLADLLKRQYEASLEAATLDNLEPLGEAAG
jgi:hypothetical protein